ncbi:MAG: multidrug ABC transporter ATP-binding protein, partial [Chthonomonadaceae bacterium]|nr:multidrug ABC transporter ATP-binding protein [Chthonomonadaceae bacterium]
VHDPTLLLLDEPASGLDPRARAELKDLIKELGSMGKMVIVSSHILPELADFCNSIGIIEKGKLITCGRVEDVVKGIQKFKTLDIRLINRASEVGMWLHGKPGVEATSVLDDSHLRIEFSGNLGDQVDLLRSLAIEGYPVASLTESQVNLEDVFLKVTTGAVN